MNANIPSEIEALRPLIRRDIIIDAVGNSLLGAGLCGWFWRASWMPHFLRSETFIVFSVATGLLSLVHLPARVRRMRRWNELRDEEASK